MANDGKRVLLAEDDPATAALVRFNLEHAGFHVTTVCNGRLALQHATYQHVDLVVTDHQMPEMDGVQWCRRLREFPQHAGTPIVFCTAKGLEIDPAELRDELGVAEVLFKPFSPARLVGALARCAAHPGNELRSLARPVAAQTS
jgi:two-component system alkaline phosphatase synthesis response regulator PhoP